MHALASTVLALSLAAPDPRTIDPDASRPEVVTEGGGAAASPVVAAPARPAPVIPDRPPAPGSPTPPPANPNPTPPSQPTTAPGQPAPTTTPGQPAPTTTTPTPAPTPAPMAAPVDPNVDRTQSCFAARGRCRRLSIAGYTTLGASVALLGAGIAFTQIEPFPIDDEPVSVRSLAPAGKAFVGVGVVGILAGAMLVVSGVALHRKFQSGEERLAKVKLDARGLHW